MTDDGDVFGTTSTRKIQLEDRTLRNACANGVAVDVMNKSDPNHYRTLCIIVVTGRPTDRFHTYQNRELRSAEASREFWPEFSREGLMKHLKTFIDLLYDQDALLEAEFTIPSRLDPAALRKSAEFGDGDSHRR